MKHLKIIMLLSFFCGFYCCEGNSQAEDRPHKTADQQKKTIVKLTKKTQQNEESRIKYIEDSTQSYIQSIVFLNDKEEIISNYNVLENNPYNQLNFPVFEKKARKELNIYKVTGRNRIDTSYFLSPIQNKVEDNQVDKFTSRVGVYKEGKRFTIVRYNLDSFNKYGELVCYRGTAKIFNQKGEIIQTFDHLETNIGSMVITNDGSYFGFTYGGYVTADGGQIYDEGFRIYEVKSKKLVADIKAEHLEFFLRPLPLGENGIRLGSSLHPNGVRTQSLERISIVFAGENEIYSKLMDLEEYAKINKIDKEGIILKNTNGKREKTTFLNYFKRAKLYKNE